MTSWTAVEDAIRAWVVAATGLTGDRVIFGEQDGTAPTPGVNPSVVVSLGNTNEYSSEPGVESVNTIAQTVTFRTISTLGIKATFKAFSKKATGELTARALLVKVQQYSSLDSILFSLNQAGLGLLKYSDVQNAPKIVNASWESQASFEVHFCAMATASETIPYIAHVRGEGTVESPGGADVDVPIEVDLP